MIKLRPATIADLELLKYWDSKQHVIESDPADNWNWKLELPRNLPWREQLIAELKGIPIGFVQIIDPQEEETHYWGNIGPNKKAIDIWIGEEQQLNKGYGTQIMNLVIDRCFQETTTVQVLVDPLKSNIKAQRFYNRLGFTFLEEKVLDGQTCSILHLERETIVKQKSQL